MTFLVLGEFGLDEFPKLQLYSQIPILWTAFDKCRSQALVCMRITGRTSATVCWAPVPEFLIQKVSSGTKDFVFLFIRNYPQVMLMLLAWDDTLRTPRLHQRRQACWMKRITWKELSFKNIKHQVSC